MRQVIFIPQVGAGQQAILLLLKIRCLPWIFEFSATMEKNIVCKICDKCFSSGKAMGGHMRSHLAKLPIPPKPETMNQTLDNSADHPIQTASSQTFQTKKKPKQNFRSLKRNFFAFLGNPNTENESRPYPKTPTRKRSKCRRKFIAAADTTGEPKQMISIPESLPAEEAAWSLVMLSMDTWAESREIKAEKEEKDGENGRDDLPVQTRSQARFECDECGKTFLSYQALGGHKASHKKNKNLCKEAGESEEDRNSNNSDAVDQKGFKCPYCSKVFKTTQALGGHKKVHFSNIMIPNADIAADKFGGKLALDLNFPAPTEDEEVSHIELETVSTVQ